ncbi:hypothetical protein HJC23_009127 [Cyclotella cryptica]|uniref:RanBP2-type domain-containing protein n=1 Tax=Cyclotella cryptica TaxID=29204 RepID=A0ABD3P0W1_9STRA|eukprot:CCRYP_018752-RA/>CCRYP_018752-RA protein AED:0.11 eAED:0.11 QI:0/-1/0/1/-1/1/1/0/459
MNTAWTCKACTWSNDDATTSCLMCQTLRPKRKFASAADGARMSTAVSAAADETSQPVAVAAAMESNVGKETCYEDRTNDDAKEEQGKNSSAASASQWDAFATLQSNYESSSDDESFDDDSENDDNDKGSDFDENERDDESDHGGGKRWDAFESLQSNYQSSDDSDSASEPDEDEDRKSPLAASLMKRSHVECIDLLDSDDEETHGKLHANTERCGKRRLDLVDSDEDPSTHNSQRNVKSKRRIMKKRSSDEATTQRKSPITLLDDSSISEEEHTRPPPSSVTRSSRSSGILPPWQRSVPLHSNQILSGNKTLPSSSFSCMNGRNDVSGGSGAGVNGFHVSRTEDTVVEKRGSKRKTKEGGGAKKKNKSVASGAEDAEKSKKARPKGKRRYRRRGRSGTASKSGARRVAPRRGTNDAWSARERGIRQRNNRNRGPATSTYMMIGKQESALRSIGGASVTF